MSSWLDNTSQELNYLTTDLYLVGPNRRLIAR